MGALEEPRVIWEPNPGSQVLFLSCPAWEVLLHGTRGGGKSDSLLMDYGQHVGQGFGPAWRGIIFRRSYKQLADLKARALRWFPRIFPGAKFNESDMVWKFPEGEELLLRYLARPLDYLEYHGWELPWIGYDELTSHPTSEAYEMMLMCSRSSMPGMPRKVRATTNPLGPGHNWVKHRFIDPAPSGKLFGLPGQRRANIFSSVEENQPLLKNDPNYVAKLDGITDPNLRKAWRHGSWDVVAGGMFDDVWNKDYHILAPFRIPHTWRIDRSFDWGSSRPFSVGWWAESDGTDAIMANGLRRSFPRGTVFRIAEWYGWTGEPNKGLKMLAIEIARGIKKRESDMGLRNVQMGPADSSIFDTQNGMCIADDMSNGGVRWTRADKSPGSRKAGAERLRTMLKASLIYPMEDPGFFVFDNCRNGFIRTVPVLPRDDQDYDDVDSEAEDHAYDDTRYRVQMPSREVKVMKLQGT